MTRTLSTALAFVALAGFAGAALAANGETPLGQCYNRVITICNTTAHPTSCAESAMDDCDEVYGNQIGGGAPNRFKASSGGGNSILIRPVLKF